MKNFGVIIIFKEIKMLLEGACILFKARENEDKRSWEKVLNTCY